VDAVPLPPKETAIGLDFGITYLVADSEGRVIPNPKNLNKSLGRLAKAQKKLARCQAGSTRRKKQKRRVARIHEGIANQRKDTLHKISRHYVDRYGWIAVEDLNVEGMVRNHSLARSISDAAWGRLRQMLANKAEEAGRRFVAVPPHSTSQKCSRCRELVPKSLSVRTHVCPACGYVADRDVNAAQNILSLARTGPSVSVGEGLVRNEQ
jgi:putative transposase